MPGLRSYSKIPVEEVKAVLLSPFYNPAGNSRVAQITIDLNRKYHDGVKVRIEQEIARLIMHLRQESLTIDDFAEPSLVSAR